MVKQKQYPSGDQQTIEARFAFVESQRTMDADTRSLRVVEVLNGSERKCVGRGNGRSEVAVAVHVVSVSAPPCAKRSCTKPDLT